MDRRRLVTAGRTCHQRWYSVRFLKATARTLLLFSPALAHGLTHRDFIPQVVHISIGVENLSAIAPELTLWRAHKFHPQVYKFLVFRVHVVHLDRQCDLLSGQRT